MPPIPTFATLIEHLRHARRREAEGQLSAWLRGQEVVDALPFLNAFATVPLKRLDLLEPIWNRLGAVTQSILTLGMALHSPERQSAWWAWSIPSPTLAELAKEARRDGDAASLALIFKHPRAPREKIQADVIYSAALAAEREMLDAVDAAHASPTLRAQGLRGASQTRSFAVSPHEAEAVLVLFLGPSQPADRHAAIMSILIGEGPLDLLPRLLEGYTDTDERDLAHALGTTYLTPVRGEDYADENMKPVCENALNLWASWTAYGAAARFKDPHAFMFTHLRAASPAEAWEAVDDLDEPRHRAAQVVHDLKHGRWSRAAAFDQPGLPVRVEVDKRPHQELAPERQWAHLDAVHARPELSADLKARIWAAVPLADRPHLVQTVAHHRHQALTLRSPAPSRPRRRS